MVNYSRHKKAKGAKKCVIKRRLMVRNYKDCIFNNKIILKLADSRARTRSQM